MAPRNDAKSASAADKAVADVKIGPDLNVSKAPLDKKLYRQILLPNGLRAVLIQDTTAFQHHPPGNGDDMDDVSSSEEDDSEGEDEFEDGHDDETGLRDAAASILVGAGSMYDPIHCQGLAHFLEHLLFMGSDKYPGENDYESFVSKHGGSDNAWTEWEHTSYHLQIPQDYLWPALDRLAQFFVAPLMAESAVDRELHSIESEFQLHKNSDSCRWQQLLSATAPPTHPMAKFSWGNLASLRDMPAAAGIDTLKELRTFYDSYYYAANMRLVVMGAYTLDDLEDRVVKMFSNVPALPRCTTPEWPLPIDPSQRYEWNAVYQTPVAAAGSPLNANSLQKLYRIVPVKERHAIAITWPLPSQTANWKSKPADYLGHLLGHEAEGSLLSYLRAQSWAVSCMAGMGDEGSEHASCHGLFTIQVNLSEAGVGHWREVVQAVYQYIGMLRKVSAGGWPVWIYEELRRIHEVSYQYSDESSPDEVVEELVEEMAPHFQIPAERLLDGSSLLFEFNADVLDDLLENYFTPENARIDMTSSSFGNASDFPDVLKPKEVTETTISNLVFAKENSDGSFDPTSAIPQVEPMFGTLFWCSSVPSEWIGEWSRLSQPQSPTLPLSLPPRNPFVPTKFDLRPLPDDDAHHPLLNSSLKLCIVVGKTKQWFPATVVQYNRKTNAVMLSYEDEDEQWHTLDSKESELTIEKVVRDFEGTMDKKKIKYRIVALAKPGQGAVRMFGDDSDFHVEEGTGFPAIPPVLPASRLPSQISNSNVLKMWHLQDRNFHRPIADLRLQIVCAQANASPLHRACADLLVKLCVDSLTETSYLADVCELGSSIASTDIGFSLRFSGFDDKLLDLFQTTMKVLLSFRGQDSSLPSTIQEGRFEACLEVLQRGYKNSGMAASDCAAHVRLRAIRPTIWSPHQKLQALADIDAASFAKTAAAIFGNVSVEALFHGNADKTDAVQAKQLILDMFESPNSAGLSRKKYPAQSVLQIPLRKKTDPPAAWQITLPSKDRAEPNTAVEVYIQVGKDAITDRVLIDLLVHMMDEPLYDQLRTQDQLGYHVSIDSRWTYGVMGLCLQVVTATHAADAVQERIERFLRDWRKELETMKQADFVEHLSGLASQKLDRFDALCDETDSLWEEIIDGRFQWQSWREEAVILRGLTKEQALEAFDRWIQPADLRKRRMLVVRVIAAPTPVLADDDEESVESSAEEQHAADGRPEVAFGDWGYFVDDQVAVFNRTVCKQQTWGRVNSKLF